MGNEISSPGSKNQSKSEIAVPNPLRLQESPSPTEDWRKFLLAISIVLIGICALAYIASEMVKNSGEGKLETLKFILNAYLPLIGTWIGTVIAFYFGTQQVTAFKTIAENAMKKSEEKDEIIKKMAEKILENQKNNS